MTNYEQLTEKAFPLQPVKITAPKPTAKEQTLDVYAELERLYSMYDQLLAMIEQIASKQPKVDNSQLERDVLWKINKALGYGEPLYK